jgi:hypothetical protein
MSAMRAPLNDGARTVPAPRLLLHRPDLLMASEPWREDDAGHRYARRRGTDGENLRNRRRLAPRRRRANFLVCDRPELSHQFSGRRRDVHCYVHFDPAAGIAPIGFNRFRHHSPSTRDAQSRLTKAKLRRRLPSDYAIKSAVVSRSAAQLRNTTNHASSSDGRIVSVEIGSRWTLLPTRKQSAVFAAPDCILRKGRRPSHSCHSDEQYDSPHLASRQETLSAHRSMNKLAGCSSMPFTRWMKAAAS